MNFFLLLQIAIKGNLRRWTGKARLWYGAAMSKLPDSIRIVDISIETFDMSEGGWCEPTITVSD